MGCSQNENEVTQAKRQESKDRRDIVRADNMTRSQVRHNCVCPVMSLDSVWKATQGC